MLKKNSLYVDPKKWSPARGKLLARAASYPEVQRIFVHPGIKKAMCDTYGASHANDYWMNKLRPYWGHYYHFHVRLFCQDGSPGCKPQPIDRFGQWLRQEPRLVVHLRAVGAEETEIRQEARQAPCRDAERPAQSLRRRARSAGARRCVAGDTDRRIRSRNGARHGGACSGPVADGGVAIAGDPSDPGQAAELGGRRRFRSFIRPAFGLCRFKRFKRA